MKRPHKYYRRKSQELMAERREKRIKAEFVYWKDIINGVVSNNQGITLDMEGFRYIK